MLDGEVTGENGVDRLDGGAGDDRYIVSNVGVSSSDPKAFEIDDAAGTDTVDLSGWQGTTGVSVSLAVDTVQTLDAGGLVVFTIVALNCLENVVGTSRDDTIYGDISNNRLAGGAGNDALYGGTGDDRLEGGSGNDRLYGEFGSNILAGGLGDDTYVVDESATHDSLDESGAGADTLDFSAWTGDVTVDLALPTQTIGEVELSFVDDLHDGGGVERVIGTRFVIDNTDERFDETGSHWAAANFAGGFNRGQRVVGNEASVGQQSATWTFSDLPDGEYEVYVAWQPDPLDLAGGSGAATNAQFAIGGAAAIDPVNQRIQPATLIDGVYWQRLVIEENPETRFTANNGTLEVSLSNDADGNVYADAVRIVQFNHAPEIDAITIDPSDGTMSNATGYQVFSIAGATDLLLTITVSDPDGATQDVLVELMGDHPSGIVLNPTSTSGVWELAWPTQDRPVGTFPLTLRVTDGETSSHSVVETIFIAIGTENEPPAFSEFDNIIGGTLDDDLFTLAVDGALEFDVVATDNGSLHYSLSPNAPAGATIDGDGHFTWHPAPNQRSAEPYAFDIRVTDDGNPPLRTIIPVKVQVDIDQAPTITTPVLLHDTGEDDNDSLTADLTLVGTVTNDGSFDFVEVEVDYDYDGVPANFAADDVLQVEPIDGVFGVGRYTITPTSYDLPRDSQGNFVEFTIGVRAPVG